MTATLTPTTTPSKRWIAEWMPLVDASPELDAAVQAYVATRRKWDWAPGNFTLLLALKDAERAVFNMVGYSRSYFVCGEVVARVDYHRNGGYPHHIEITPLSVSLRARRNLEATR